MRDAIEAYLFDLKAAGRSQHTILNCECGLRQLAEYLQAQGVNAWADVTPADMRRQMTDSLSGRLKPSSVGVRATQAACFFNWLQEQELISANPMQRVRRPRKPQRVVKTFTDDQLAALFAAAETSPRPLRNKAIVFLFLDCGLRLSELLAISPPDYDRDTATLTVKGKGRKVRQVKLGRHSREAFEQHLQTADGASWHLGALGLRNMIRKLGKRAGVHANPHKFRHTFACRFLDAGGTIDELQYLMGHSHIATTMIYAVAGQEQRALKSHAAHSPLDALL